MFIISDGLTPINTGCLNILPHLNHAHLFDVLNDFLLHSFSLSRLLHLMKTLHQNIRNSNFHSLSTDFFFASLSRLLQSSSEPDKAEDIHAKLHESRVVWGLLERGQGGLPQEHVHNFQLI
jgi:hypothetical protein